MSHLFSNFQFFKELRNAVETPRGSWASFDLRNSVSDALLSELLQKNPPETIDSLNEIRRLEDRQVMILVELKSSRLKNIGNNFRVRYFCFTLLKTKMKLSSAEYQLKCQENI